MASDMVGATSEDLYILCKFELEKIEQILHTTNAANDNNLYRIYCHSDKNVNDSDSISYMEYNLDVLYDTCDKIIKTINILFDKFPQDFKSNINMGTLVERAKECKKYIRLHMMVKDPFNSFITNFIEENEEDEK